MQRNEKKEFKKFRHDMNSSESKMINISSILVGEDTLHIYYSHTKLTFVWTNKSTSRLFLIIIHVRGYFKNKFLTLKISNYIIIMVSVIHGFEPIFLFFFEDIISSIYRGDLLFIFSSPPIIL